MGIIQHSQCTISLNYICLVVAFTFHWKINCVSMAAPSRLHNGMHYCFPPPHLTTLSGARGKKKKKKEWQCSKQYLSPAIVFLLKGYNQQA